MPKYVLPEPEMQAEQEPMTVGPYGRTLYVPANKEILDALTIGDTAEVKLVGKVVGLESRERDGGESNAEFQIELRSVEAYGEQDLESLIDDEDS